MTPPTKRSALGAERTRRRAPDRAERTGTRGPAKGAATAGPRPRPDEFPHWPELKLEIVSRYASAYSRILSRQPGLSHYYIEGFAGPGVRVSGRNGELVTGSPLNALLITPPFRHHYLADLDGGRVEALRALVGSRADVTFLEGDWSRVLLEQVLARVRAEDYRRALCLLDPSGLHLDWRVIETAGRLGTIDLFVSLPVLDANGDALWSGPEDVLGERTGRMTRLWGDDSWQEAAGAATAFRRRLREVARFVHVHGPLPLRNAANEIAHHLFFASRNDTANPIVEDIFARWRDGVPGPAGTAK